MPASVIAQALGGVAAILIVRSLYPDVTAAEAAGVIVPHPDPAPGPLPSAAAR